MQSTVEMMPSIGAAAALVPSTSIGIRFWIAGVPGIMLIVKEPEPRELVM